MCRRSAGDFSIFQEPWQTSDLCRIIFQCLGVPNKSFLEDLQGEGRINWFQLDIHNPPQGDGECPPIDTSSLKANELGGLLKIFPGSLLTDPLDDGGGGGGQRRACQ